MKMMALTARGVVACVAFCALGAAGAHVTAEHGGGPVVFYKTTTWADCLYRFEAPGVYSRDVTVVPPAKGPMWYAFESCARSTNRAPVVNEGRIVVPALRGRSCARIANSGTGPFIQKGAIETGSRLDVNGNVTLACPFRFSGKGEALFADDVAGRIQVGDGFSFGGEDGLAAGFVRLLAPGVLGQCRSLVAVSESAETIAGLVERLPPEWRARCKVSRNGHRAVVRIAGASSSSSPDVVRKMPDDLPPNRGVLGADGVVTLTVAAGTPLRRVRDEARGALAANPGRPLVVSLAEGVYPVAETIGLSLVDSGTSAAPVTWRGEGHGAVFSGAARLGAWRAVGDGTWRAAVPREADGRPMWAAEFFANGVRRPNAAYPSDGRFIHATNITERILAKTYGERDYSVRAEHTLFLSAEDFRHVAAIPDAELKFAHVRIHSKWNAARHFIVRIDRAAGSITIQGTRWPPWNRYNAKECPLRIENLRTELRNPGDWFYDATAGELAYVPMKGEEMGSVEGTIPCDGTDVFLRLAGDIDAEEYAGNMRFENIVFRHGSTLAHKGPADVPDSLMLGAVVRGMFLADGARNVVFDGCRWEETGGAYGVWFREGCMSNAVVNCTFRDMGGGAVRVGLGGGIGAVKGLADELENVGPFPFRAYVPHSTAFITVENNLVERGGRYMPGAGAIVVGAASDCRIVHNRIDDLHYTAITCNWDFGYRGSPCQRCLVAFNHISRVGHGDLSDMGGVYMAGTGFGNVVARNVIRGVDGMVYGGWGLYPDEGTEGVLYESNLVYDTKDGGIHQHFGRDNVVRNNVFAFSREGQVAITRPEPHRSWIFEGNIVVWEKGDAFAKYNGTKSEKAIVDWKRNLWWRLDGQTNVFNGKSFSEWQAKGKDVDGLYADPLFVDAALRDFRFRDASVARKIGFRPFDFTRAGLHQAGVRVQPVYDTSYASSAEYDIRRFGAAEDAAPAANAAAIQRAIDAAAKDGGGRVVVPSGTFTSGTIWLKPNVELHLAEGSVLKASGDVADYNAEDAYPENWGCPPEQWRGLHFIIARGADGASITGPGTLHGNGDAFYDEKPKAYFAWMKPGASCWWNGIRWSKDKEKLRPGQLVTFVKCRNVAVRGITIRNSPCWSLWFWGCDGVQVSDYTVRNGENDGNSDGIDFDCSRNVVLERADIDTGDDAIAVRASARAFSPDGKGRLGLPAVTENIRIRDCRLRSTSSVFRIGVGEGVIRDVSVDNVTCDRGGTAVNISTRYGEPKRAGTDIERVMFRNCHFTNCRTGAVVRSNGGDHLEFGIRDIRFENCSFGGCKPVVQSDRGVKFPVSAKDVTFVATP